MVQELKTSLNHKLSLKDLGVVDYFLGIQVQHAKWGLYLSKTKYIIVLLCQVKMQYAKVFNAPMKSGLQLTTYGSGTIESAQCT